MLLHGLMGSGALMASDGPAPALAERGYRVILPDLRGHGDSGRPHDPACYPPDVLADDGLALIDHLGLDDYHLGGYSLGGKLVLRLLARGARPACAIVGGQGLDALDAESGRTDGYRRLLAAVADGSAFKPGSPEEALAGWLGADRRRPAGDRLPPRQLGRDAAGRAAGGSDAHARRGGRRRPPRRVRGRTRRSFAERAASPGPRRPRHGPVRAGVHGRHRELPRVARLPDSGTARRLRRRPL